MIITNADTMDVALDLPNQGLMAIVGAGGKTTAMFRLASELTNRGLRVACATTTKILLPDPHQAQLILVENNTHLQDMCRKIRPGGRPACLGWAINDNKLMGLEPDFVDRLADTEIFDWILVEADGARRLPLKAPADYEPLIPTRCTHVLAMAGLTAIGTPLDEEHVCRSTHFAKLSGLSLGASITPTSVARVCAHPEGMFKNTPKGATRLLWLNQADAPRALDHGREILGLLRDVDALPRRACLGATACTPCVMELWM